MLGWDDLRLVLVVAREGSLAAASRALGVNHSTVSRRFAALEARLDRKLFERTRGGWRPTALGAELVAAAERMDEEATGAERRLGGSDARLSGTLRVATADIAAPSLALDFADFARAHPEIELEIVADARPANLTRREADVAVRASRTPPEHLVGRRVAELAVAVYASEETARGLRFEDLARAAWIAEDDSPLGELERAWRERRFPAARVRHRANTAAFRLEAVKAGLGVAALPCFRADVEPTLRRVGPTIRELALPVWLLTHPDVRGAARVRAFVAFMARRLAARRDLLAGDRPLAGSGPAPASAARR